ncbi:formylglycine-generating enzyme family protein [Phreatobacter stygius]|uniref:Formylglycine-generating enzyme family protein n=2 Tax=Phreatobacter stygius TaxID=1940610 RepID=A0A4D7B5B2_9HYPH|nr:formylglycine-generating enzyme family protein [Phreatobacter stygius]
MYRPGGDVTCQDMLEIPGGDVGLRDDRTKRQWNVAIQPFMLARYPVTQAFYRAVTAQSPAVFKGDHYPVENVSWFDAIRFCNRLSGEAGLRESYRIGSDGEDVSLRPDGDGYRLPSEAEWEYACRAGTGKVRYGELDDIAWYRGNSGNQVQAVGQKQPNAWGLHDMLGNVWEWCWDQYDPAVYGPYRVFRGGGWADAERGCLATNRRRSHPTFRIDDLGFRIARSA